MSQDKNCGTHGKVINKVKVFKKYAKLQGQGHRVIDVVTRREVLSQKILITKALALTVQKS